MSLAVNTGGFDYNASCFPRRVVRFYNYTRTVHVSSGVIVAHLLARSERSLLVGFALVRSKAFSLKNVSDFARNTLKNACTLRFQPLTKV